MNLCYLALGSNLKSPQRQLRQAIAALRKLPNCYLLEQASLYRSHAFGRRAQPDFVNTVICLRSSLPPKALLALCQRIEKKQGRIRNTRWGSRTLDVDLLLYGSLRLNSKELQLPHPRLHLRDFVFIPLLEISSKPIKIGDQLLTELIQKTSHCLTVVGKVDKPL